MADHVGPFVGRTVQLVRPFKLGILGQDHELTDGLFDSFGSLFGDDHQIGITSGHELLLIVLLDSLFEDGDEGGRVFAEAVEILEDHRDEGLVGDVHAFVINNGCRMIEIQIRAA